MNIFLSVGHSILKSGSYTSADGRKYGGVLEYEYCKELGKKVGNWLLAAGHDVDLVICPERQFTSSAQEKDYKLTLENRGSYDLACELHLNASNGQASGCEVYYKTDSGKLFADRVQNKLAQYFANRGAQKRTDLYILNGTRAPAILVESFFCDSAGDCAKAGSLGYDVIGKAIAEGIHGSALSSGSTAISGGYLVQITDAALNYRSGPGTEYSINGTIKDQGIYTIMEEQSSSDGGRWGRLKSGAGWINLKYTKKV